MSNPECAQGLWAHLGTGQPSRHAGELVAALLWMVGEQAVIAHEGDLDGLKDRVAEVVDKLHHLGVVVTAIENGRDAQQHGLLHRQQRHYTVNKSSSTLA